MLLKHAHRVLVLFACSWIIIADHAPPAFSQEPTARLRQQELARQPEVQIHGAQAEIPPEEDDELAQDFEFDYGGYLRFGYYNFRDADLNHVLRIWDLRLWTNLVYEDTHQFYVRLATIFTDYNDGMNYFYQKENDWNVLRGDLVYYNGDISRMFDISEYGRTQIRIGRDFTTAGMGMVLDRRGDGAKLNYDTAEFNAFAFYINSVWSDDMYDRTYPDFGHDKRTFFGVQASHEFTREADLYGFLVWQKFDNDNDFDVPHIDPNLKWGDDTVNGALGIRGVAGAGINYTGEVILQGGSRYSSAFDSSGVGFSTKDDVQAWALNVVSTYTFREYEWLPRMEGQFIYGSGDKDAGNTLDTVGGNEPGTDFNAFTSYGYLNTGLSFFPQPSNLRILRLGSAIAPFRRDDIMGEVEFGVNYFYYNRIKENGGISDRLAVPGTSFIGWELDAFLMWRPFSDLSIMIQYGYFFPYRDAFLDDDGRPYFSFGTLLFF